MVQMLASGVNGCRALQIGSRAYKLMLIFLGKSYTGLSQNTGTRLLEVMFVFSDGRLSGLEMCWT